MLSNVGESLGMARLKKVAGRQTRNPIPMMEDGGESPDTAQSTLRPDRIDLTRYRRIRYITAVKAVILLDFLC